MLLLLLTLSGIVQGQTSKDNNKYVYWIPKEYAEHVALGDTNYDYLKPVMFISRIKGKYVITGFRADGYGVEVKQKIFVTKDSSKFQIRRPVVMGRHLEEFLHQSDSLKFYLTYYSNIKNGPVLSIYRNKEELKSTKFINVEKRPTFHYAPNEEITKFSY